MSYNKVIPLTDLLVDVENPRFSDVIENQNDALITIAKMQDRKLIKLAEDINEYGINPSELLLVKPIEESDKYYIVLEGNRRVAALKILENPEIIKDSVSKSIYEKIKKINNEYEKNPIDGIDCIVFDSREEAYHWIELKHTGENEGAGVVSWGTPEIDRFRRRSGQQSATEQILEFLSERNFISGEIRRDTPISSLKRLLSTPHVRRKLGIEIDSGVVKTKLSEEEVAKGLKKIVEDLALQTIRTTDIYYSKDRINYIDSLNPNNLPNLSQVGSENRKLEDTEIIPSGSKTQSKPRNKPSRRKRSTIIPSRELVLKIDQSRINDIFHELRKLNINDFPNAASVLYRVFVELSLDEYVVKNKLQVDEMAKLSAKLNNVADHLRDQGKLSNQELKPVRRAAQSDHFLGGTLTTMHQYIHNQNFHPSPQDLIASWDSLEPFFKAVWE